MTAPRPQPGPSFRRPASHPLCLRLAVGFRAGQAITNLDQRPAHVDSILDYGYDSHPDFFFLCCNIASSEGGGASYLVDLTAALERMPPWAASALESLTIVQKITVPSRYGLFALPENSDGSDGPPPPSRDGGEREERLFLRTAEGRKMLRVSSFSDAASLLEDMEAGVINLRPTDDSADPERDMRVVRHWLHAVAVMEQEASHAHDPSSRAFAS